MEIKIVCECGKDLDEVNVSLERWSDVPTQAVKVCLGCIADAEARAYEEGNKDGREEAEREQS